MYQIIGYSTTKVRMPQVVGALMAGLLLRPAMLGLMEETDFLQTVAELGVIVLMFSAGLETDIRELKKSGKASLVIAVCGVIVSIAGGFLTAYFFNKPEMIQSDASCSTLLQNIFIGVILTATIGLSVTLPKMTAAIILFTLILVIVAILTKVIGYGLGAKLCGYQSHQCRRIGVGMVSRGEVALIVASKGTALGLLGSAFVGPIVVMVVITTIITPILLKVVYKNGAVAAVEAGEDITGHYDELANVRREHQS